MLKYIASIPVVLSILAGAYGSLNYINKLTAQIDDSTDQIMLLVKDIESIHEVYGDKTNRNSKNYTEAREELVKEISELTTWIGRIEAKGQAMEKLLYETASHSELRAMEEIVRSNQNDIQQFKYDMKDLERQLSGGY